MFQDFSVHFAVLCTPMVVSNWAKLYIFKDFWIRWTKSESEMIKNIVLQLFQCICFYFHSRKPLKIYSLWIEYGARPDRANHFWQVTHRAMLMTHLANRRIRTIFLCYLDCEIKTINTEIQVSKNRDHLVGRLMTHTLVQRLIMSSSVCYMDEQHHNWLVYPKQCNHRNAHAPQQQMPIAAIWPLSRPGK